MKSWMKWAIATLVVVVLALVAGPFIYINVIKDDAPDPFTFACAAGADAAVTTRPVGAGLDGAWIIAPGSSVGYRVVEVLFGQDTEGVGRTDQITGELAVSGTQVTHGSFEVDMTAIVSDDRRRDNQFNGRLMDTTTFPTATLALTAPIDLPTASQGCTATASGELTLRDVTKPVTFEVQAQKNGDAVQVVGSTDIVFADYGIPQPDAPGITTQDHGLLEFDLQLSRD